MNFISGVRFIGQWSRPIKVFTSCTLTIYLCTSQILKMTFFYHLLNDLQRLKYFFGHNFHQIFINLFFCAQIVLKFQILFNLIFFTNIV